MSASLLALFATALASVQVAGGSGSAARLQKAIDACPAVGCDIELSDSLYRMEHQLWIEGKEGVRIRSIGSTPSVLRWEDSLLVPDSTGTAALFRLQPPAGGGRPAAPAGWLRWPVAYEGGVGTAADLTDPLSTTGFQHNGLVLVKSSRSVRLEGLVLDGVRPAAFVNPDIWNKVFDLIHGSVGVSALQSRGVEIVGCELKGFWTAVYLKDRNLDCASWMGGAGARPWSSCGTMGGHLVEANRIHGNTVGIYSESAWDLGSVFRDNLAWDNYTRARTQTGTSVYPPAVLASMDYGLLDGGFMRLKDNLFPAHPRAYGFPAWLGRDPWSPGLSQESDSPSWGIEPHARRTISRCDLGGIRNRLDSAHTDRSVVWQVSFAGIARAVSPRARSTSPQVVSR